MTNARRRSPRDRPAPSRLGAALLPLALGLAAAGNTSCRDRPSPAATPGESARGGAAATAVQRVSGAAARKLVADGATLVDVRTAMEFEGGHIEGAKNIPIGELPDRLGELPKDRPVMVYCAAGARAGRAASLLAERGYSVYDLSSMAAWDR